MCRRLIGFSAIAAGIAALLLVAPVGAQQAAQPTIEQLKAMPTPKDASGHPDLNAQWGGGGGGGGDNPADAGAAETGDIVNLLTGRSSEGVLGQAAVNFEQDNTLLRRMDPNRPLYRPEFWDQVKKLDQNGNHEDPSYKCMPAGVPRMGAPQKILVLSDRMIFLYGATYRTVPTDGRPHTPEKDLEGTWMGESLGSWQGDTFVVDTIGLTDSSWLNISGYFHGENMHVTETFKREGNTLTYQAKAEDPDVLLKPFMYPANTMRLNANPKAMITEGLPCYERDLDHLVTNEHH